MNVVGNCPQCGNPIYASSPDDVRRTCLCAITMRPVTIPAPPTYVPLQPYYPPTTYPIQPGTWWCSAPDVTITSNTITNTLLRKPPDEDAGMVPK